jgi:hypothetical protein
VTEFADSAFDRTLSDGTAGYTLRARFERQPPPSNPWRVLSLEKRTSESGPWYNGPVVSIYQRTAPRQGR